MRILDLFAGLGGEQRRPLIEKRGHELVTLDFNPKFNCTFTRDLFTVESLAELERGGRYDMVWASPDCAPFSVASIPHHWTGGDSAYIPKTEEAVVGQKLVAHTRALIEAYNPVGWLMENPRGVLRKLPCVAGLPRQSICFCRYGDTSMKPTDPWGHVPRWQPRPMCHNGHPDHEEARRGARTGTQGKDGAANRAVVPWQLWADVLWVMEGHEP